jgi:hypothetical protein
MAIKIKEEALLTSNGNGTSPEMTTKRLTSFQAKYMRKLIANFERAKAGVEQAQSAANDFVVACSEEAGIRVGEDGWTFDIDSCEFVRVQEE